MKTSVFKAFMNDISQINSVQKRIVTRKILIETANPPLTKGNIGRICPVCSSTSMHKHGSFGDKVRYICTTCGTTLNDGSHLITHRSQNPEKWPTFIKLLIGGYSTRQIASELSISPKTAFLWRKKVQGLHPWLMEAIEKKPATRRRSD